MKNLKYIIGGIVLVVILFFLIDKCSQEKRIVEVPIKIDVPVPPIKGSSDTLINPSPIRVVTIESPLNKELKSKLRKLQDENRILFNKYKKADSLSKQVIYKDAITIREYEQKFIDSFQTITVHSKTRGKLLSQHLEYETNEYTIPLDTVIKTEIKEKFKIFGLLEIGSPVFSPDNREDLFAKGTFIFKNSKDNGFSLGIDNKGSVYGGYLFKF